VSSAARSEILPAYQIGTDRMWINNLKVRRSYESSDYGWG